MIRSKEYRRIVNEMVQVETEKHDGIDELAFFALVAWLQQKKSADSLLAYLDEAPWDDTVRSYLKDIFSRYSAILFPAAESLSETEVNGILDLLPLRRGISFTAMPAGVAALSGKLLQLQKGDRVADLCAGLDDFSLAACRDFPGITCLAVEKDTKAYIGGGSAHGIKRAPNR